MKGVILAAGYGTRFLPGTKTIPKEMFPLIDTPAIDLIVREFTEAGLEDILIVTSRRKRAMEDYFDREVELEGCLSGGAKERLRELIRPPEANFFFTRQRQMNGTGDALLQVEPFTGNSPFVVAYPDDILLSGTSLTAQLMELHRKTGKTVLAGQEVPHGDISRYGVIATERVEGIDTVSKMVEKPPAGSEPSRLVGFGRYLYTPELFDELRATRGSGEGEFTQTDAINAMAAKGRVVVKRFEGKLLDVGTPQGYLEAIIEYGLSRDEYRAGLLDFIKKVAAREE